MLDKSLVTIITVEVILGALVKVSGLYQWEVEGVLTCPPKSSPVLMLDWRLRKGGYFIGQKNIQTGANHQQAARS